MDTTFQSRNRESVSLFWPILLIGVGLVLLLGNAGRLTRDPLELLAQYWPVIFILIGVDVLFSRTGWLGTLVSALLGLALVGGAILYLTAPGGTFALPRGQGLLDGMQLRTEHIAQPLAGTRTATVELNFGAGESDVRATNANANERETQNLVKGDVSYYGALTNHIEHNGDDANLKLSNALVLPGWPWFGNGRPRWNLRLNPDVRYDFQFTTGSGTHTFDLSDLDVRGVSLNQGSGRSMLRLPEGSKYHMALKVASGDALVTVPRGMPVQVNYIVDSGGLSVGGTRRIAGSGLRGTYESPDYVPDGAHITFDVHINSGDVAIR